MTTRTIETAVDLGGPPPAPGDFIREDILIEHGLTQQQLANRLGVSRRSINELITRRRAVSTEMALRLSELTGQSAEYWLNLQNLHDVWVLRTETRGFGIKPLSS